MLFHGMRAALDSEIITQSVKARGRKSNYYEMRMSEIISERGMLSNVGETRVRWKKTECPVVMSFRGWMLRLERSDDRWLIDEYLGDDNDDDD